MRLYYIIFSLVTILVYQSDSTVIVGSNKRKVNPVNVHIITIGIDDSGINDFPKFKNFKSDALFIKSKIEVDSKTLSKYIPEAKTTTRGHSSKSIKNEYNDSIKTKIFTYSLLNEDATLNNIRKAFKEVIKNSTTNDYFYFYFAGLSTSNDSENNFLITYNESAVKEDYEYLSLKELANFMNQISAKNQLVISESGTNGKSFAEDLQSNLFELDPDIALNTERNRIILTTLNYAYGQSKCNDSKGPLVYYIENSGNLFEIFHNYHHYEYLLNKTEIACSPRDTKYYFLSQENDYKKLISEHYNRIKNSRGSIPNKLPSEETTETSTDSNFYALIIATNKYNEKQNSWNNLKNPVNDANAVAEILEKKYGAIVTKLYNEKKQYIKDNIINLKKVITENDKLLIFIAGHGYYSNDYSQGYIVTTDSESLEIDAGLDTYFPMSTLKILVDSFNCKPILTILDVCYGASFEINNANLDVENYSNTTFDNGIKNFIIQTDESYSRIVLASGESEVPDFWNNSLDHSPFANKLLKALENEKIFTSPGKIFSYLKGNATKPILKKFGKHEVTGDFLLQVLK